MNVRKFWVRSTQWDRLASLGNTSAMRATVLVPFIGYAILVGNTFFLESWKLEATYFGLIFLALGQIVFHVSAPHFYKRHLNKDTFLVEQSQNMTYLRVMKFARNIMAEYGLEDCTEKFKDHLYLVDAAARSIDDADQHVDDFDEYFEKVIIRNDDDRNGRISLKFDQNFPMKVGEGMLNADVVQSKELFLTYAGGVVVNFLDYVWVSCKGIRPMRRNVIAVAYLIGAAILATVTCFTVVEVLDKVV